MKESHTDKGLVIIILGFCILNLSLGIYANYRLFRINKEDNEKNKVVEKKEVKEEKKEEVIEEEPSIIEVQEEPVIEEEIEEIEEVNE